MKKAFSVLAIGMALMGVQNNREIEIPTIQPQLGNRIFSGMSIPKKLNQRQKRKRNRQSAWYKGM